MRAWAGRHKLLLAVLGLLSSAIAVLAVATYRLFVDPRSDPVRRSDAVVVIAGGPLRLNKGIEQLRLRLGRVVAEPAEHFIEVAAESDPLLPHRVGTLIGVHAIHGITWSRARGGKSRQGSIEGRQVPAHAENHHRSVQIEARNSRSDRAG